MDVIKRRNLNFYRMVNSSALYSGDDMIIYLLTAIG
jgi:hypothetical protein